MIVDKTSISLGPLREDRSEDSTVKAAARNSSLSRDAGFTLVEIMIVVLIIGILLAIAVPQFTKARANSRQKTIMANLKIIDDAKEQCAIDKGAVDGDTTLCNANVLRTEYIKAYPANNVPVTGNYNPQAIGTPATFRNQNAAWWNNNPNHSSIR